MTLTLSSGGLAEPSGKLAEASARLGGGGGGVLHRRSISDGQPTGGAGGGAAAAPPFRLSGTLHKKAQRTGIYQKREVVVEGSTLTYRTLTSETPEVLSGGNIERLEVVSLTLTLTLALTLTLTLTRTLTLTLTRCCSCCSATSPPLAEQPPARSYSPR